MPKLTAVILPAKALKNGKHKVRIAIAHNSETRYILTDIILDSIKEFKNGQIVKRDDASYKNTKLRKIISAYQESIDDIGNIECLTCPELISVMQQNNNRKERTISSVFIEYIQYANIKPGSIAFYQVCFRSLSTFTGPNLLVSHISHKTVIGFDKWLREQKLSNDTIRNRMTLLMTIINHSQRCQYAEYRINPFSGYKLPEPIVRESWLSTDEVRAIRDVSTEKKNILKCRDIFMLSYYLGGLNIVDMLQIDFNQCTKTIHYIRIKTEMKSKINKFVEFEIPEEAKPLIEKYKDINGKLHFVGKMQDNNNMPAFLNYNLQKLAKAAGIQKIIFYAARKSFSQHAFLLGVNTSVIDYILGHKIGKSGSCLYSYIKVTPDMATEAIRKVLDNLK